MYIWLMIGYNRYVMQTNGIYNLFTRSNDRSLRAIGSARVNGMLGSQFVSLSFSDATVDMSTGSGPVVGVGGCED